MSNEHDTISAGPENPDAHAAEVVEAARAAGALTPETERAILAAGRAHGRMLERIAEPEPHE